MGLFALLRRAAPSLASLTSLPALVALVFFVTSCDSSVGGGISTGGEGGSPPCDSCYNVFVNGGIACGPGASADAWHELANCACGLGPCANACTSSFCISMPASGPAPNDSTDTCSTCMGTKCSAQLSNCAAN